MPSSVTIREVELIDGYPRQSDLKLAVRLFLDHLREDPSYIKSAAHTEEGVTEWFKRKALDRLWFAEDGDETIGVIGLKMKKLDVSGSLPLLDAELCRLVVAPKARKRGIARALHDTVVCETVGHHLWLTTLVGSVSDRMYRRWGWEVVGSVESADDPLDDIVALHLSE